MNIFLRCALAALCAAQAPREQLLRDPGFEDLPAGPLATTGPVQGWEVQRHGRDVVQDRLVVAGLEAGARSGRRCLSLSIPRDTVGFEFVTIGQRLRLAAGREVEASAWVRWTGGPAEAPAAAEGPSAIVSFWARHRDGTGHFAGRDVWLRDSRWTRLTFRFRPTDPGHPTLVYLSLLPHQKPVDTTVLVDDVELTAVDDPSELETRTGNLVRDPGFAAQKAGPVAPPWSFANMGGTGIAGAVAGSGHMTMAMGKGTSNFESAQLWQHLELREGARYEISARLRWDGCTPDAPAPIVNYGIYHEGSNTWYGPVDQVLEQTGEWRTYAFTHVPPYGGSWKLYVQLNGWGNFGNGVSISIDDLSCSAR